MVYVVYCSIDYENMSDDFMKYVVENDWKGAGSVLRVFDNYKKASDYCKDWEEMKRLEIEEEWDSESYYEYYNVFIEELEIE